MSQKMLRPFIVKICVLGAVHFALLNICSVGDTVWVTFLVPFIE